jgi:hypothetical protein
MTQIEDMLRATLAETPTASTTTDPLTALDRRVRRARRRLALGAGVAAAAIAAAVVVPLAVLANDQPSRVVVGDDQSPSPTPSPSGAAERADVWLTNGAHGVATNDARGHSFVVTEHGNGATRLLVELGPDGSELQHWTVPESALFVAQREGAVWIWGGGDGAFPTPIVTAVDVQSGTTASVELDQYGAVTDLAITEGGSAWAVVADHVLQLRAVDGKVTVVAVIPLTGAQRIVSTVNGHLWVQADTQLIELVPTGAAGAEQGVTVHWAGTLFAAAPEGERLWVENDSRQIALLDPLALSDGAGRASTDQVLDLPAPASVIAPDGIGGLFVAFLGGGLAYYDPQAVRSDGPPAARLARATVDVETMATTLDGGVILQDYGGVAEHWLPSA